MIIGERIQLIALNDECFDLTYQWVNNPSLRLYTGTRFPITKLEHEKWFVNKSQSTFNKTFGIQIKDTNKIIGIIGNSEYDSLDRTTSIFIYLGDISDRGHGYGTEALNLMTKFCFDHLNVHKVWAHIFNFNSASLNLFTNSGYTQEGLLKQHVYRNGKYIDVVVVGRFNLDGK